MMYDILLINPINHYELPSNPLGIQIIHSICEKNGYKVKLLDLALEHKREGYFFTKEIFIWIENKIKLYPSKYYGISIMNGTFIWGLEIAKIIKKLDYKKIVFVGGSQATALKEKVFDITTNVDYCLLYEGETTVLEFLNMMEDGKKPLPCNVIKKDVSDYRCQLTSENINEIPQLDYTEYYNIKIVDIEVGRGCPYSCYYCSAKSLVGHNIRYKKIEKILAEGQDLYDNMCAETREYINFNHDNFLSSRKTFKEFINKKFDGKYSFPYGCEGRIDAIDDEIIDDLYKSNCVYLFVGLETGSERMQEISKKRLHLNDIKSKIKKITDKGIFVESNFIIGFPEETLKDLYQTIRLVAELSWISPNVRICYSFMSPEPGSDVFYNTNLDECVMVKDDHIYLELKNVGFDIENMPVLYFNHLYTIQNPDYDVLYYIKCASIYFPMLYNYYMSTYLLFKIKNKDICEVFESLGDFCSAEEAISYFYEREKKSLSPIECDMVRYEMDLNYVSNNDVSEYSFEYNYPVQKIYKKFKQNKDNYFEWKEENEIMTKIVSKK